MNDLAFIGCLTQNWSAFFHPRPVHRDTRHHAPRLPRIHHRQSAVDSFIHMPTRPIHHAASMVFPACNRDGESILIVLASDTSEYGQCTITQAQSSDSRSRFPGQLI